MDGCAESDEGAPEGRSWGENGEVVFSRAGAAQLGAEIGRGVCRMGAEGVSVEAEWATAERCTQQHRASAPR